MTGRGVVCNKIPIIIKKTVKPKAFKMLFFSVDTSNRGSVKEFTRRGTLCC